jgi:putative transcriptional regulator
VIAAEEIDVARIRKRLKLSQAKFAERFHLSAATIRDWEQKRRNPDRIAVNLLRIIEHAPETVERALNAAVIDRAPAHPLKRALRRAKP